MNFERDFITLAFAPEKLYRYFNTTDWHSMYLHEGIQILRYIFSGKTLKAKDVPCQGIS